jgi:sulfide:quinone oxidoreductase
MPSRIVIVGSNFAGFTAALELKKQLAAEAEVIVISATERFLFMPSLIWVPFGLRRESDISFPLAPIYAEAGVVFRHTTATRIDLENRRVVHGLGEDAYDFLIIATGPKIDWAAVPGLGPDHGFSESIFTLPHAQHAREAWARFLQDPGPLVVGGVQGASCFGAAYEFLFNAAYQIRKHGIAARAPITFATAEPFLAHFGIGGFGAGEKMCGWFFEHYGIRAELDAEYREIAPGAVTLADGRSFPFRYAMITPAFLGVDVVRALTTITDARGFVRVGPTYQTGEHPEVYAVGVAVHVDPPGKTAVPCGVPKTGYLSEEMAKVAVHNIVAELRGEPKKERAVADIDAECVLDAGDMGLIMSGDRFLGHRDREWLIPGPEAHWAKLAFEKYFLFTRRHGWV